MPLSTYLPEEMGSVAIAPLGPVEAGSFQSFFIIYTAGKFGIDDSGSLKIVHRFASDLGRLQMDDPEGANYVSAQASNGAVLHMEYDLKRNFRPWDKTLYIKVVRGFLSEGDRIVIRIGDRRYGGPGVRMQTFQEKEFQFRVLVDAFATYDYVELPNTPSIEVTSGPPVIYKAVLPTLKRVGETFLLGLKGEDRWGNPSAKCEDTFRVTSTRPVENLPDEISFYPGQASVQIDGLRAEEEGDLCIDLVDMDGNVTARSNPLRIVAKTGGVSFWADLHGQSQETIGTNNARSYFSFARDRAFLDATVHQGNDFQITSEFWDELNSLSREFTQDSRFIVIPGYEWSANTCLGGDRNILYAEEGRPIYRSSHALVEDTRDLDQDANSVEELFDKLQGEDVTVFAHVGGRYADIRRGHDRKLERSVEVHSAWGTFEWLVEDAFEMGYRTGILATSDGHKGRPGASHPGATRFGAYGGLTCLFADDLTRANLMTALKRRHHYCTTGCRAVLSTKVTLDRPADRFDDDPALGGPPDEQVSEAVMGDILRTDAEIATFEIDIHAAAPIERIDIRDGLRLLETWRPSEAEDMGRRIRVIWEGSEYRGRGRETIWDGFAELSGNTFARVSPINWYNIEKRLDLVSPQRVEWSSLTTGGFIGFDAWLDDMVMGWLRIDTPLVKKTIAVQDIGREDIRLEAGGLGRRVRVYRVPEENPHKRLKLARKIPLSPDRDNALYVRTTLEDGHVIWSSPIYLVP